MQSFKTQNGMSYTASSQELAQRFEEVVTAYLGFNRATGHLLKGLLTDDPDMPMAQCMMGYFQKLFGNAKMSNRAQTTFANLAPLLESNRIDEREQHLIAALGAWSDGDLGRACDIWERILVKHPSDALTIRLAHFLHFYSGDGRRMRDSVTRVLPRWSADSNHYGYVLGMGAFGHEECGEYARAETLARQAVERNPEDIWSVHALAHVFEMQERHRDGIDWIDSLHDAWSKANNFRFHVAWHRCLYQIELGDYESVLQTYDDELISDLDSGFNLDLCNATSLLWRLEMHGIDIGERWQRLAEISRDHIEDRDLIFVSLHYFMALVSVGDQESSRAMLENIRQWSEDHSSQGDICRQSGLTIAQALHDVRTGRTAGGADNLRRVRYLMDSIGGSKAQRDVFHMIMLQATKHSGDDHLSAALFAERTAQRPTSAWGWRQYAEVLETTGQTDLAQTAHERLTALAH